tara:strand:- start:511 stop:1272 length:762 start_codon:yes stop_codon:yes gene_type:complete
MAEFPALPIWTDAYIADTQHLTNEEHGVYLRLLMFAWRSDSCSLPDNDKRLALMVGVTDKKWRTLKPNVMVFWDLEGDTYTQKKLTNTRRAVAKKSEDNRVRAERRWNGNSLISNNTGDAVAYAGAMPNPMPNASYPKPKLLREKVTTNVVTKNSRGTRWTSEDEVPPDWIMWAEDQDFDQALIMREAAKFPDYWAGISGAKGVKLDWSATWRNWIRTASQRTQQKPGAVIGFDREAVAKELEKLRNAKKSNL